MKDMEDKERKNNLNEIFGTFYNFETAIYRVDPSHNIPIIRTSNGSNEELINFWESENNYFDRKRYVLVKLIEGKSSIRKFRELSDNRRWEKASYILRFSTHNTHLGIVGEIMEELQEKASCKLCLCQNNHANPVIIAKNNTYHDYATVEGAGFMDVNRKKKKLIIYERSRSFTISYDYQKKYYLGMTGHEFAAKILSVCMPENWKIIVVNNNTESRFIEGNEKIPNPPRIKKNISPNVE